MAKKVFVWSPVRKLMKDNGAEMVAREAVDALIDYLEKVAVQISSEALKLASHSRRKTVTPKDMKSAMRMI